MSRVTSAGASKLIHRKPKVESEVFIITSLFSRFEIFQVVFCGFWISKDWLTLEWRWIIDCLISILTQLTASRKWWILRLFIFVKDIKKTFIHVPDVHYWIFWAQGPKAEDSTTERKNDPSLITTSTTHTTTHSRCCFTAAEWASSSMSRSFLRTWKPRREHLTIISVQIASVASNEIHIFKLSQNRNISFQKLIRILLISDNQISVGLKVLLIWKYLLKMTHRNNLFKMNPEEIKLLAVKHWIDFSDFFSKYRNVTFYIVSQRSSVTFIPHLFSTLYRHQNV